MALGAGSTTAAVVNTTGTSINGNAYTFAGTDALSTVSVGSGAATNGVRTITNVAAGRVGATSTDAINGSQLYATNSAIEDLSTTVTANKTKYYSVNSAGGTNEDNLGATGADAIASGKNAVASGNSSYAAGFGATAASANSVALGVNANASNGGLIALGMNAQSLAQNTIAIGGTASVRLGIAIGFASNSAGNGAVAIGDATTSNAFSTVALGQSALATNDYAISMGRLANASNVRTTALGANSIASGTAATAVGATTVASGNYATATGGRVYFVNGVPREDAYVPGVGFPTATTSQLDTQATGLLSSAYGAAASATADRSLALGSLSSATVDSAVALGSGSVASTAAGIAGYVPPNADATQTAAIRATTSTLGAVSVGDAANGQFRQINGVAAGTADSDAVNVSQLKALDATVAASKTKYYSVQGSSTGAGSNADNDGATGLQAMAAGEFASAGGNLAVAMGTLSEASGSGGVAIGSSAAALGDGSTAVGYAAYAGGADGTALGHGAAASFADTVAIGHDTQDSGANSVLVGTRAGGAANSTALGYEAKASVEGSVALGSGSVSDRAIAGTQGTISAGTNFVVPYNTTDKTLLGAMSVGSATSYRQITNVADGTEQQDAVTVRQLTGALQSFAVSPTKYFHANSTAGDSSAVGTDSVAIGPQTIVNGNNGIGRAR